MAFRALTRAAAMAVAMAGPVAAESEGWMASGLEIVRIPAPIVDIPRIQTQQAVGCGATSVRFGDTAFMRGFALAEPWPDPARLGLAAAEMTDDREAAYQRYRAALAEPGLTAAQRAAIEGQWMLAALQFGDLAMARQMSDAPLPPGTAPQMRADRRFWGVLLRAAGASAEDWAGSLDADLGEALNDDPGNFSVRAWRLFAWLRAHAAETGRTRCGANLTELQRRALEVSEASPCPLMLGHFDLALSRFLRARPDEGPDRPERAWHAFAAALLSEVAGNVSRTDALAMSLAEQKNPGMCRGLMLSELARLRGARR